MNDFPLLPTRSSSPRDRSLAAAANDAMRACQRLAEAAVEHGAQRLADVAIASALRVEACARIEMEET